MDRYYYAYYTGEIKKSASGGIGYALASCMLEDGVVYGVKYKNDFRGAQYVRITRPEELEQIRGSKYIRAEKKLEDGTLVFHKVWQDLSENRKVLFTGLPCEVGALYQYLENRNADNMQNLITADLVCQGPLSAAEQIRYIEFLEKKYKSRLTDFSVRYKNPWWKPVYLRAVFENGKEHKKPLYQTDFGRAFLLYGAEGCFRCTFKGEGHQADMTLGDFWEMKENEKGFHKMGTSLVITHTQKGDHFLQQLPQVEWGAVSREKAIDETSMYDRPRQKSSRYEQFRQIYEKKDLHSAVFAARSIWGKGKYFLQLILGQHPY